MKNVLITGASGGLGKELAIYFSKNGWHVIATMICFEEGKELFEIPNVKCYLLDVTNTQSILDAKNKILNDFKTINVIINNAGIGYRSFVELSEDTKIDSIVNINWLGVVKICRAFIPVFRQQNYGLFINITSIAGLVNLPLGNFYHSTKKAVESFSECMAYELVNFNIKVCTVQFGNANTNFQKNVIKCNASSIQAYENMMNKIDAILQKKNDKNKNLLPLITKNIFLIAQNPPKNFKRYTIGFDALFMRYIRAILGYKLFSSIIRRKILK